MSEARAWFEIGQSYAHVAYAKGLADNRRPGFPMNAETDEEREKRKRLESDLQIEMRAYTYALSLIEAAVERGAR